jgi:hypothetical protein
MGAFNLHNHIILKYYLERAIASFLGSGPQISNSASLFDFWGQIARNWLRGGHRQCKQAANCLLDERAWLPRVRSSEFGMSAETGLLSVMICKRFVDPVVVISLTF